MNHDPRMSTCCIIACKQWFKITSASKHGNTGSPNKHVHLFRQSPSTIFSFILKKSRRPAHLAMAEIEICSLQRMLKADLRLLCRKRPEHEKSGSLVRLPAGQKGQMKVMVTGLIIISELTMVMLVLWEAAIALERRS